MKKNKKILRCSHSAARLNLTHSIIKTLCYSQIFSYPLTASEIWKYLIHNKKVTREDVSLELYKNRNFFVDTGKYIVLPGDTKLVRDRNERAIYSRKKLAKSMWVANLLSYVPTIKMIGISGSLSMYNSKKNDDIDLFFITAKNSLWTTRLLVSVLLLILSEKRSRGERYAKDKICPNMFIAEGSLSLPKEKRSLYTAHEVAQLKVLYSKDNTYSRFIQENRWALRFMPNAFEMKKMKVNKKTSKKFFGLSWVVELLLFKAQFHYMKKKVTNEKVGINYAFFHPNNQKAVVEELFELKRRAYTDLYENQQRKQRYSLLIASN